MVKSQTLATNCSNTFNRVHQLTDDVLNPANNQYFLDLESEDAATVKRALVTALECVHAANVILLRMEGGELKAHGASALGSRRSKVVSQAAVLAVKGGTPVLDEHCPLPVAPEEPADDESDSSESKKASPKKAASKKASAKKPAKKAPAKKAAAKGKKS